MLGVLFYHVFPQHFPGGYLGVVTFFVMAGFLGLAAYRRSFYQARPEQAPGLLLHDIVSRLKRLLPELLFMLFVCILFMFVAFRTAIKNNAISILGSATFTNNWTQIFEGQSYFEQVGILKPFTHIWALAMEFQFHLMLGVVFLTLYIAKKRKLLGLALLVMSVISYFYMNTLLRLEADMTRVYYDTFGRFFSYSIGAIFALSVTRGKRQRDASGIVSAVILSFLVSSFFVFGISGFVFRTVFLLYSIAVAMILYIMYNSESMIAQFLQLKPLQMLGERSFSIYLWHYPILAFMEKSFAHIPIPDILFYALYFVITALISEVSYRLFTKNDEGFKMVQALNSGVKYASMAVVLIFVLGISINSMFSQGSSELDQMKRMILENEQAMAKQNQPNEEEQALSEPSQQDASSPSSEETNKEEAQTTANEVKPSNDAGLSTTGGQTDSQILKKLELKEFQELSKYLPKANVDAYLGRVFQVVYGNRASEFKDRFYRSLNPNASAKSSASDTASENAAAADSKPEAPKEKTAGHKRAEGYIAYVNEFGDKVSLDLDKYGKYRTTKMLIIGDSIASMSFHTMQVYMPEATIDGSHSRQFKEAYETYQKHLKESGGDIGDFVVLSLGTNGAVKSEDIDKVRNELNGRKLILISIVLPYKAEEEARNAEIYAYAKKYDDVYLVDWHDVAKNQNKWFFEDNIHPGENGAKVYSQLIIKKIIEIIEGR